MFSPYGWINLFNTTNTILLSGDVLQWIASLTINRPGVS